MEKQSIELSLFCSAWEGDLFGWPWSKNDFSYATDRRVLIRVDRVPDVPEPDADRPDIEKDLGRFIDSEPAEWFQVPDVVATVHACDLFKTGRCDGRAIRSCGDLCDGNGQISDGRACIIGNSVFRHEVLELIKGLPGIEIGPFGPEDPAKIRFTGGVGLVMPCLR